MPPRALEGRTNNVCSNNWWILFLCLPHLMPNKDPDPKAKEIKNKWMSIKDPPSTESEIWERNNLINYVSLFAFSSRNL